MGGAGNYLKQHDYHPNIDQSKYPTEQEIARQGQPATPSADEMQKAMKVKEADAKYRREIESSEYQKFNQAAKTTPTQEIVSPRD